MRTYPFRLKPGQDLKKEIMDFVSLNELRAATLLTCVGSLTRASLRLADQPAATEFPGPFEIVSLVGTASAAGGAHFHISVADSTGRTIGGHLMDGNIIHTTAEVVLGELEDVEFTREHDAATGYRELKILPRTS